MKKYIIFIMLIMLSTSCLSQIRIIMFDKKNESIRSELSTEIKRLYKVSVTFTQDEIPSHSFNKSYGRYRAGDIIRAVSNGTETLGITSRDISITKGRIEDWGVFGLGSHYYKSAVVSSYRLNTKKDIISTCLHELGHVFGLPHCESKGCLMNDAKGKLTKATYVMCEHCKKKLNG